MANQFETFQAARAFDGGTELVNNVMADPRESLKILKLVAAQTADQPTPSSNSAKLQDPNEVINLLESNFSKIDTLGAGVLTKRQLEKYATTGDDQKIRAAAQIALGHFDDLSNMLQNQPDLQDGIQGKWYHAKPIPGISMDDLKVAQDAEMHKDSIYMEREQKSYDSTASTVHWVGVGAAVAAYTAAAFLTDGFAIPVLSLITVDGVGHLLSDIISDKGKSIAKNLQDQFEADRKVMSAWPEVQFGESL